MNTLSPVKKIIPLVALAASTSIAYSGQDQWTYPQSIDDFGNTLRSPKLPERSAEKPVAHSRTPAVAQAPETAAASAAAAVPAPGGGSQEPDVIEPGRKFTVRLLISMKKADRIPARTLARCELEMDECLKDRLGRGYLITRASEACRVEDVCLLPVSLDYAQFTLVSRMIKAQTNTNKKHDT